MYKGTTIDFIGIGAPRSGTTWLWEQLRKHPDVNVPDTKELHYFTTGDEFHDGRGLSFTNLHRGFEWYMNQFPEEELGKMRGEFSASYLVNPRSAKLIHEKFPDVKLFVCFRNPAEMIYSWYWLRGHHNTLATFDKAVRSGQYLNIGKYHTNIQRYLDLFARNQIHVTFFEDIKEKPKKVLSDAFRFLGVRDDFVPVDVKKKINATQRVRSVALRGVARASLKTMRSAGLHVIADQFKRGKPLYRIYTGLNLAEKKYPSMPSETQEYLAKYYRTEVEALELFTGRDLTNWK